MSVTVTLNSQSVTATLTSESPVAPELSSPTIEVTGTGSDTVTTAMQGARGLSAYEIAVAEGFAGDQSAWLASLGVIKGVKFGVTGKTITSEHYVTTSEYTFTISQTNSSAKALTGATSSTVFTIKRGPVASQTTVGTFTFAPSATTATVSITAGSITAGDILSIYAPVTPDATLADIAFTLRS
jgi:hypothetical protein